MARSAKIQTNLLGARVRITHCSERAYYDKEAEIVNVFLDRDGDPRYTLRVWLQGRTPLWDTYHHAFEVVEHGWRKHHEQAGGA